MHSVERGLWVSLRFWTTRASPRKCLSSGSCLISPRCRITDVSLQQPLHLNKHVPSLMTNGADGSSVGFDACVGPCTAWKLGANSTIRPQPLTLQTVNSDVATCQVSHSFPRLTESAALMLTAAEHNANHPSPSSHQRVWLGSAGWIRVRTGCLGVLHWESVSYWI